MGLQAVYIRSKKQELLITNRNLNLLGLNTGQTETYSLTTNRNLNLHRRDKNFFLQVDNLNLNEFNTGQPGTSS